MKIKVKRSDTVVWRQKLRTKLGLPYFVFKQSQSKFNLPQLIATASGFAFFVI